MVCCPLSKREKSAKDFHGEISNFEDTLFISDYLVPFRRSSPLPSLPPLRLASLLPGHTGHSLTSGPLQPLCPPLGHVPSYLRGPLLQLLFGQPGVPTALPPCPASPHSTTSSPLKMLCLFPDHCVFMSVSSRQEGAPRGNGLVSVSLDSV